MVNLFSTIALILSLGGQILLFGKNRLVFPLWILSNVCWIMVNIIDTFNLLWQEVPKNQKQKQRKRK